MQCSFCGREHTALHVSSLDLCPQCANQLLSALPSSPRYDWYLRRVREALFPEKKAEKIPAFH